MACGSDLRTIWSFSLGGGSLGSLQQNFTTLAMHQQFNVYSVQPSPPPVAAWLQALLGPVNSILKADPVALELRPLGAWGGLAPGVTSMNPDGRIQISNRMLYCSKSQLVHLYVHELAHSLLCLANKEVDHQHDAAFFCLNAVLLQRLDINGFDCGYPTNHLSSLSLYDLQDPIPEWAGHPASFWRPRAISWALSKVEKYAGANYSALELAKLISNDYFAWAEEVEALPVHLENQKEAARDRELQRQIEFAQLRESHQLRGGLAWAFGVGFFSLLLAHLF